MTTDPQHTPGPSPDWVRGMTTPRMTRRSVLKAGGAGAAALSLSSILAACGGGGDTAGGGGNTSAGPSVDFNPASAGDHINFSNWPVYIDKAQGTSPSLEKFQKETGISVTYSTEISENSSFVGELLPQLQAGQDTGRDIIVISNGEYLSGLILGGYATELDPAYRPNFDANAASWAKSPAYDPGNRFTMAWQSGLTGLGFNTELMNKAPTKLDDLMSTEYFPPNSIGVLKEDGPNVAMINLGIDPINSGQAEWDEAAAWLTALRDSDTFYAAYDQGYLDDLTAGNLAGTMSWSGDVLYYKIWEGQPFEWIVPEMSGSPEQGALLWIDNMLIPANSANPAGSLQLMDFYYNPENAQMVTEWVLYMSPVPEVQDLIAQHGKDEEGKDPDYAAQLAATAENPLLWPDEELLSKVSFGRPIVTDEESTAWHDTFDPIWQQ